MQSVDIITAIGASIIVPTLTYLKTNSDRRGTAKQRDTDHLLLKQRVQYLECEVSKMDDMRSMMQDIRMAVSEIKVVLEFFKKHMDEENN